MGRGWPVQQRPARRGGGGRGGVREGMREGRRDEGVRAQPVGACGGARCRWGLLAFGRRAEGAQRGGAQHPDAHGEGTFVDNVVAAVEVVLLTAGNVGAQAHK